MNRTPKISCAVAFSIVFCSAVANGQTGRSRNLHNFSGPARPTAFSSDGKTLAVVVGDGDKVQLWNIRKKSLRLSIPLQYPAAFASADVVLSSDGVVAASTTAPVARADVHIKVWDARSGKFLYKLHLPPSTLFYSRDKKFLSTIVDIVGTRENKVRVTTRHTRTGKRVRSIDITAPTGLRFDFDGMSSSTPPAPARSRSSDGQWVAMSLWKVGRRNIRTEYQGIALYNARNGKLSRFLQSSTAEDTHEIVFSPDSRTVAIVGRNRTRLWDTKTGKLRAKLKFGLGSLVFSPDSIMLASAESELLPNIDYYEWETQAIKLWSVRSGKLLHTFTKFRKGVTGFAFSPNSRTLATGDNSGKVRLWRVK